MNEQLDQEVAEKVMGDRFKSAFVYEATGKPVYMLGGWSPQYRIADAWEVVERLESLGWLIELYSQGGCWSASLEGGPTGDGNVYRTVGVTAPHVICLVALKAMAGGDP